MRISPDVGFRSGYCAFDYLFKDLLTYFSDFTFGWVDKSAGWGIKEVGFVVFQSSCSSRECSTFIFIKGAKLYKNKSKMGSFCTTNLFRNFRHSSGAKK